MKKITCIQQYVIDKLIDDEKLSIGSLIDAKFVAQEDVNTIAEKLEPYNVIISIAGFY